VYQSVGADRGGYEGEFLATEDEVKSARKLLEDVLCSHAKSFQDLSADDTFVNDAAVDLKKWDKDKRWVSKDAKEIFSDLTSDAKKIELPGHKDLEKIKSKFVKVRKIHFADCCKTQTKLHPAPDPMLLLLKAASNWLRRQDLYLLPACGAPDADDDDYIITIEEEWKARGWHVDKEPSEISCNLIMKDSFDDASLTDEDD
jgi:hypothetical protein